MKGFIENDIAEEYERLRFAIGQPDFDSLPNSPHQPVSGEEFQQVPQPLRLGGEHQGEANDDVIVQNNRAKGEEEAGGHTAAGTARLSLQEVVEHEECHSGSGSGNGTDAEENKGVEHPPQSSPTNEDAHDAHDHYSGSPNEFGVAKGTEAGKSEGMDESTHRGIKAQVCEEEEKSLLTPNSQTHEHRQDPQGFVKSEGEQNVAVQMDLAGNLTAATRKVLRLRQAKEAELGAVQAVDKPVALPGFSGYEERPVGSASLPQCQTQCSPATSDNPAEDILEARPSTPREGKAKSEVDDFFIASNEKSAKTPPPKRLPLAAGSNYSQQHTGPSPFPSPSRKSLRTAQAVSVLPKARLPHDAPWDPSIPKPSALELLRSQQRVAPNIKGAPKPLSKKPFPVQKPSMNGKASKDRAQKTLDTVARGIAEATGGKSVFTQNGRRVRIPKLPRPKASTVYPSRPPRYPTPVPPTAQPTPEPLLAPRGLENIPRELVVSRSQPGPSGGHPELLRPLNTFSNPPHWPANGDEKLRMVASTTNGNRAGAAVSPAIPASGAANPPMADHECPGRDPASQGSGAEIVAPSPTASTPTVRKSVKRKLELTAEERQEKKRIRAMRNRQSAERSRRRRKEYAVSLESNVQERREKSQEWRGIYFTGLTRLSGMQRDIREMYGDDHQITTPIMHDLVDDVRDMVGSCQYTFSREEPEIELRNIGEDGRRGGRGRGGRGRRARGAGRCSRVNRGGRGEQQ